MKFIYTFVFVFFLACIAAKSTRSPLKKCLQCEDADYDPICGGPATGNDRPLSFGSECIMRKYNCENNKEFIVKSKGECKTGGGIRLS